MSKVDILEQLPKLTPEERHEVRAKLNELDGIDEDAWLDEDDPLTNEDKGLIDARVEAHDRNPDAAIPWEQFDAQLKRRLGG